MKREVAVLVCGSFLMATGVLLAVFRPQSSGNTPIGDPPCTDDTWTSTSITNVPEARGEHTAVWTGSEMIIWGGDGNTYLNTGGRYNPITDSWTATSTTNAPDARNQHTAVWTGSEMIVWGGWGSVGLLNTGGRYNPVTDSWTSMSTTNAPQARAGQSAVWTGSEMIVWGGNGFNGLNTGGRYNPVTDTWTATTIINAPSARQWHTAVWTGSEMIVWGGADNFGHYVNTGGRYNPITDSWTATSTTNAPDIRRSQSAVWTGSEMILWGGWGGTYGDPLNTGGRYNPSTDTWTGTSSTNVPEARGDHTAVWTGSEMIVWGGLGFSGDLNTGGRYNTSMDSWTATSTTNAPEARFIYTTVWTGSEMIVWGGSSDTAALDSGGRYCAQSGSSTPTPTPTPAMVKVKVRTNPVGRTFTVDGTPYSSQQQFTWIAGSNHTIATTSPQSGGSGVQYVWTNWSDGGAISHIVAPTSNGNYTAMFKTQYFLTMGAGTGGTVQPASGWRNAGTSVIIKAHASPGFTFSNWTGSGTGSYTGTNNPGSIIMNGPIRETGHFSP